MKMKRWLVYGCISILCIILMTGCASIPNQAKNTPAISPSKINALVTATLSPTLELETVHPKENSYTTSEKTGNVATVAGNDADPKEIVAFNTKQPSVMGLTLKETENNVNIKYGTPSDSFVMDDPAEPITVYQYEGFSVGFDGANQVKFIDVSSAKVNPLLNGLRLGQTVDEAVKALGKPDLNTNYVLTYNAKEAILKLDIDPKTKTIQSIKLFGKSE
ncbi:MAG: hypothetical protein JWM44_2938 [Bacilli bacterium]|nr:hypothetical protein [Bacilli bacterium]